MLNFLIQIIISIFIGVSFIFLAKRYQKSQVFYFCIGFFTCLIVRIIYLVIYGLITDFKINQSFSYHRNISIIISIIISYVLFRLLKERLHSKNSEYHNINEIGKQ